MPERVWTIRFPPWPVVVLAVVVMVLDYHASNNVVFGWTTTTCLPTTSLGRSLPTLLKSSQADGDNDKEQERKSDISPFGRAKIVLNPHGQNIKYRNQTEVQQEWRSQLERYDAASITPLDPMDMQRDQAILALHQQVQLDLSNATALVEEFPQLYNQESCPNLATRLFYLNNQLGMSIAKIQHLLKVHPRLLIKVLLDNPEETISTTVQVLQQELGLSLDQIVGNKLHILDRMEVKKRLALLKQIFDAPNLKQVVLKDPTCLRWGSTVTIVDKRNEPSQMGKVLKFFRNDMLLSNDQVASLVRIYPKVLTLSGSRIQECRVRWAYVVEGPIGEGLITLTRRGIDPSDMSPKEQQRVLLARAQEFILRDFKTLLVDTVLTTTDYLLHELNCSSYYLGRIAYRRPQIFQYAPETIQEKVEYFMRKLELNETGPILDILALMPDVFTQSLTDNLEPKFDYLETTVGLSKPQLRTLILVKPQVLALGLENNLKRKIDYLVNTTGIPLPVVRIIITEYPTCLRQPFDSCFQARGALLLHLMEYPIPCPQQIPLDFLQMGDAGFDQWLSRNFGEEIVVKYRGPGAGTRKRRKKKATKEELATLARVEGE
jgi:hypothetical protein